MSGLPVFFTDDILMGDPFPAVWNHDNRQFSVSGTPFWIDWWAAWGLEDLPLARLEPQPRRAVRRLATGMQTDE
jgi:hypothetical protein